MKVALYSQNHAPSVDAHAIAKILVGAVKGTMQGIEINASRETQLRIYCEPDRPNENQSLRAQLGFMQSDDFMTAEQIDAVLKKLYSIEGLQVLPVHHRFTAVGAEFHFIEFFVLVPAKTKKAKKGAPTNE